MDILLFGIFIIIITISIPVYFDYNEKREIKRRKNEMEKKSKIDDDKPGECLKIYNSEYHSYNDPYYSSRNWSGPHMTKTNDYDPISDPMSPCCPWGYWSM